MSDHIPEPLVLLASAGTGKTFRLSSRFLELVANGAPVQDILATTFTKKAAGEILDRILVRLSKAALEESAFAELLKHVEVPDEWSREHAIRLLRDLVKNLHRFEVRTLDAWFQQNLQVVALELGLPPGWSVGDPFDLSDLRAQAILEVIAGLAPSQADALLRDLQQHEFKRSVFEGLLDLLDRTLNIHLSADNTGNPWDSLSDCSQPPVQEMEESAAILAQIKVPTTGKGTPNKNWATNVTKLVKAWQDRSWKEVLSSSLMKAVLEDKSKFSSVEISDGVRAGLKHVGNCAARTKLAELHRSNLALCELVSAYSETYSQLKRKAGLFDFDDIPRLLTDNPHDPVANHRLGKSVKHLLLDEFQDTSVLQWQVLEPRIDEATAQTRPDCSLLCVGDVKQAIYSWREGESDLLDGIADWYNVCPETLSTNYRSSQKVLDAVNLVFCNLGQGASFVADCDDGDSITAIADWAEDFPKHDADKDLPGSVWLLECTAEKRLGSSPQVTKLIIHRIEDLHRQAPKASIGVLLHRKKNIQSLLLELKRRGIRASGEGGNLLTDSKVVQLALSLFRLADHAGDTTAFFHVATSPLAPFFELELNDKVIVSASISPLMVFMRMLSREPGIPVDRIGQP